MEVLVVGSASIDLVTYSATLPAPGETLLGTAFERHYGGKGANQAVQCAQLGVKVGMCGKVGSDQWGLDYVRNLNSFEIDTTSFIQGSKDTGIASIFVSESGANSIVIVPGANNEVTPDQVLAAEELFASVNVVVCQNEIPFESTRLALRLARKHGCLSIFNPAPASALLLDAVADCDIVCPNETELATLTSLPTVTVEEVTEAARRLLLGHCRVVVVTLGERGALLVSCTESIHLPTTSVKAVDTVGAGDSFIGTLAANLCRFENLRVSVERALACATLSVQLRGAQESYRHKRDIPCEIWPPDRNVERVVCKSKVMESLDF